MWESVALTLAGAAGYSIGTVLQKKGTLILPPLSFELKVIRLYALNRLWISGFLLDICGAALMLTALSQAPVSVVQPIAGCELGILCIFSHFYLKEVMNGLDWIAVTLAGIGAIGVGVGGEEQKVEEIPLFSIPWLVLCIVILFVLLNTWLRIYKKQRREQDLTGPEVIEEVIYGLESGILFGVSSVILKMGFVMSEMGFTKIVVPAAISCSVACSAVGFVFQTRGLKHGRAIVVSTCTSVASIVSGVVVGMVALDEHLPTAPTSRFFLLLGWFFIITGMILLVTSTQLIACLPKPVQKFLKSNMERSHSIMSPGSARGKDPIQSTSIHASSLQHILSCAETEDDMNVEEVEKLKGKQKWGLVLATRASARIKHDGKTIMEKAQDLAKSKNLETVARVANHVEGEVLEEHEKGVFVEYPEEDQGQADQGVVSEGGLYPCEVANTRPRRVKRKAGRVDRGAGSSRKNAAAADVAGTWVRELNGRIHQVSIKKLDGPLDHER